MTCDDAEDIIIIFISSSHFYTQKKLHVGTHVPDRVERPRECRRRPPPPAAARRRIFRHPTSGIC
jgi:hypothetical protein